MKTGMGSHEITTTINDEWLTPLRIIKTLGKFDLDPCSPINRPWDTAKLHYTKKEDGLSKTWCGRVWCNPPYGKYTSLWLDKLSKHNNGIALIFARTETKLFFNYVWEKADSILFIKGRLWFCDVLGVKAKGNAGAPSVLVAYGENNTKILKSCEIKGKFINIK